MTEQRANPRYKVRWRSRLLLPSKQIISATVIDVSVTGLAVLAGAALPIDSEAGIEFFPIHEGKPTRMRAKTRVVFSIVHAESQGARVGLQFKQISVEDTVILKVVIGALSE